MTSFSVTLEQYARACDRLAEVLALPKNPINRDSAIKRFEICFDLAWKALKSYLEEKLKVRCASPKACFREAYTQTIIPYEDRWLAIADDRNSTAHLYKEEMAEAVYAHLSKHLTLFQELLSRLQQEA